MSFLSKSDLLAMYSVAKYATFEKLIGKKGKEILNWQPGHQRFTPKQLRLLHRHIGPPLKREEKYN